MQMQKTLKLVKKTWHDYNLVNYATDLFTISYLQMERYEPHRWNGEDSNYERDDVDFKVNMVLLSS